MLNDLVLAALATLPDPVGSLVRAFPGRTSASELTEWLDAWFLDQVKAFFSDKPPKAVQLTVTQPGKGDLSLLAKPPVTAHVRLLSIMPHYFRGFRSLDRPVDLDGDLVVIEGPNSSGKTSLSEALEWLFTGQLSRRVSAGQGHPRELANCIANEFCPDNETTWVECIVSVDQQSVTLKRVLTRDYTSKIAAAPQSDFYRDGTKLSSDETLGLLESLFAGVPPMLMQHTLRQFVHDTPDARRQYFERLLQIDELTALIEKAVIGDVHVATLLPPTGAVSQTKWADFQAVVDDSDGKSLLSAVHDASSGQLRTELSGALMSIAASKFKDVVTAEMSIEHVRDAFAAFQAKTREQRFPFVALLRPRGDPKPLERMYQELSATVDALRQADEQLDTARRASAAISDANLAVSRALQELVKAGLVALETASDATCPVCVYTSTPTLTAKRIAEIRSWQPLATALDTTTSARSAAERELLRRTEALRQHISGINPAILSEQDLDSKLATVDPQVAATARKTWDAAQRAFQQGTLLITRLEGVDLLLGNIDVYGTQPVTAAVAAVADHVRGSVKVLAEFTACFAELEQVASLHALDDRTYLFRERWLAVADDTEAVAQAVQWQQARVRAQSLLALIRDGLINLRTEIIEDARRTFSDRMTEVWASLRRDGGSRFSRLMIPSARGRGYKLEIEVKAIINDGKTDAEVDALKVFSESQVNLLGLAAFITRSTLLGHSFLVFDDPVQSMDEEHFRSFADKLLSTLLSAGHQVVVLTHSDLFARDIADQHYTRARYVTMTTRASRRHGCQVDEGNRRVAERLKKAEELAEEGKLHDAWKDVRLAMERLYTLVCIANQPGFDGRPWRDKTAEYMWESGVGSLVEKLAPGAGTRLRAILTLTAAGAHDKTARGVTDLKDSVEFLRSLLAPLRVGSG